MAEPEALPEPVPASRRAVAFVALAIACMAAVSNLAHLGFLTPLAWWVDLFAHFVPQRALFIGFGLVCAGVAREPWRAAANALLLLVDLARLAPEALDRPAPGPGPSLRVLFANVRFDATDHAPMLEVIRRVDPDLVALTEVSTPWGPDLDAALAGWPVRVVDARRDPFGVGLWSKVPMDASIEHLSASGYSSVRARLELGGAPIDVVVGHPVAPIGADLTARRDAEIRALGASIAGLGDHVLVVGDFNSTPWAASFAPLWAAGLRGGTARGTWPSWAPGPLTIPLDHTLVRGLEVRSWRVEAETDSDHYPLVVEIGLP